MCWVSLLSRKKDILKVSSYGKAQSVCHQNFEREKKRIIEFIRKFIQKNINSFYFCDFAVVDLLKFKGCGDLFSHSTWAVTLKPCLFLEICVLVFKESPTNAVSSQASRISLQTFLTTINIQEQLLARVSSSFHNEWFRDWIIFWIDVSVTGRLPMYLQIIFIAKMAFFFSVSLATSLQVDKTNVSNCLKRSGFR